VLHRRGPLAEQDMVRPGGETRHAGGAEPAPGGETEPVPVEGLRLLQGVNGKGPGRDAFDVLETPTMLLRFPPAPLPTWAPPLGRPARRGPPGQQPAPPGAR
jgi:hypothetical protein